jgi:chromosome segregation protein
MYLKKLELSGFKSFGKKCELIFNAPISAIVGPNGSGKSNVAEAFRFVLGEQSIKSMRGKKGEDLIFNGGGERAGEAGRANRASVKITFDNRKRFLDVDFDEVSVERVVYRDGINEYLINGTQVRLKDVTELIAGAHISSSGHHTISQGEADRILNANIKDRKTMIEDALGLKIYQYKREESERKLVKTGENIKSVESLRREIVPHLKFLKKQVEKVEKTVEMRAKIAVLYKEYLKRESLYISHHKKAYEEEKAPLDKKLKELEKELSHAKEILSRSKDQDEKSAEIISLEEKIRKTREEKDSLMRELGRIEGGIASEERIIKKQKEIIHSAEDKIVTLREVEELAHSIDKEIEKTKAEENLGVIQKIFSRVKDLVHSFVQKHKTKTSDNLLHESEAALAKLKDEKSKLEKKLKELEKEGEHLEKQYSALKTNIEKEKDTNRDAEKKVFEVMSLQNEVISKLNIVKGALERLHIEEENFKREMGEAGAIVGREILDFESFEIAISQEQIANAPRGEQEDRRRDIERIKIRLEDSGVGSSDEIMKEFRDVSERDTFLAAELTDLEKSAESLQKLISDLHEKIETEFKIGIEKINKQFQDFFSLMFGGGTAALSVVKEKRRKRADTDLSALLSGDESALEITGAGADGVSGAETEEEQEDGVDISINLPRKKIKGLMMLSGGERALTSIALIFAISQVNPPPFIILDETDAALDEANSKKYGDMIENLAKLSQLILITHNRETMSRASILYGVTMSSGVSKLLSIQFDEAVAVAK